MPIPAVTPINTAEEGTGRASRHALPPMLPPGSVYTSCYCEENVYLLAQAFAARRDAEMAWPWDIYDVFISNPRKTVALWKQKARPGDVVVWDYHVVLVLRRQTRSSSAHHQRNARPSDTSDGLPCCQSWVYDFDTLLLNPCPWPEYVSGTFPYTLDDEGESAVGAQYRRCASASACPARLVTLRHRRRWQEAVRAAGCAHDQLTRPAILCSLFRVVPADAYLDWFASDRSHMLKPIPAGSLPSAATAPDPAPLGVEYASPPPPYPPLCGRRAVEAGIAHNFMEFISMSWPHKWEDRGGSVSGDVQTRLEYGELMDLSCFIRWFASGDRN